MCYATELAYRDKGAEAVLEKVLELAEGVIGALPRHSFPETPASVHEDANGHEDQEGISKLVVANKYKSPLETSKSISARHAKVAC